MKQVVNLSERESPSASWRTWRSARAGGRRAGFVAELSLAHAIGENPICTTSNLVARRSAFERVGGFDPTMRHAEDQEWVARVLAATRWAACGVDATTVDYRLSANGLSADLDEMLAGWSAMLERIRALQPLTVAEAEPAARALFERYLARHAAFELWCDEQTRRYGRTPGSAEA